MASPSSQEETLTTFIATTAADDKTAKAFLRATGWNINTAMDRYFAFNGDASKLGPPKGGSNNGASSLSSNGGSNPSSSNGQQQAGIMSAISGFFNPQQMMQQPQSQTDQDALLAQQLAAQSQQQPQQRFGGIRAPDQAFQERLVGPYSNQFGSSLHKQRRDAQEFSFLI